MSTGNDPKRYYARLGVEPSASAEAIKSAYRQLAKKLHPDIDRDAGAKARFQAINEAYGVLSDPDLRSAYDALQYTNPASQPRETKLEPICCSQCGRVTAQPRSTVFYRVVSLVVLTTRTPIQGIFCSACGRAIAFRATLCSAFFGWWGFPWGPIWTISSICQNALGGRHSKDIDEKLIWYNALAFFRKGQLAISYALAQQIRTAHDAEIAISAVKLMDHLRAAGVPAASPMLKNPWQANPLAVLAQFALLLAVPSVIGLAAYSNDSQHGLPSRPAPPSYHANQPSYSIPTITTAPSSQTTPATNAAPVPTCAFPPSNGEILVKHGKWSNEGHSIEITNGSGGNAIIKVRDAYSASVVVSFFVAKGATASIVNVPDGTYRIQYAFGGDLRSDCRSFVRVTSAAQFPDIESLRTRYTSTEIIWSQLSYTLFSVPDGNVRPQALDVATFNAE